MTICACKMHEVIRDSQDVQWEHSCVELSLDLSIILNYFLHFAGYLKCPDGLLGCRNKWFRKKMSKVKEGTTCRLRLTRKSGVGQILPRVVKSPPLKGRAPTRNFSLRQQRKRPIATSIYLHICRKPLTLIPPSPSRASTTNSTSSQRETTHTTHSQHVRLRRRRRR